MMQDCRSCFTPTLNDPLERVESLRVGCNIVHLLFLMLRQMAAVGYTSHGGNIFLYYVVT